MKRISYLITFVVVIVVSVIAFAQQSESDRPPGVAEDEWLDLSDNAGIILGENLETEAAVRGDLVVKIRGEWKRVYPSLPPVQAIPLR